LKNNHTTESATLSNLNDSDTDLVRTPNPKTGTCSEISAIAPFPSFLIRSGLPMATLDNRTSVCYLIVTYYIKIQTKSKI